ncbi:unnamed protein product [Rotaria magnacalcarata]|nr:unnamed protein product [Rotaria magnacalcarata]
MENITGYIVDLTDEKRGPVKFYKRFTIITTEQEKISGWIFSSTSFHETTIENTLTEVIKKQTAVTIKGKITTETGDKRIMRIFLKNKHDQPISIAKVHGKFPSSAIVNVSIQDALTSEDLSRITIKILHENLIVYYEQEGDGIKLTFWTIKGLLKIFIQQQQPDEQMNNEDIS